MNFLNFISKKRIFAVMRKEFIQLGRDRVTLRMIIGIPIMQLTLFGFAINSDPKHLPTAFVSQDHSEISRNIVTGLVNSGYFKITAEPENESEAQELIKQGKVIFNVIIPENFERNLIRGERPHLLIQADATDPIAISSSLGAVNGIMERIMRKDGVGSISNTSTQTQPYEVRIHKMYNPEGLSRYNIVPGLIAIVLTMTGVMMTAVSLTRERERGTMENLLSMPVKPVEVMVGKIAPYIIIGYIQAAIIVATAHFLFGVPIMGSMLLLAFGLFCYIMCNLALGFTLSTGAKNQMQAMQMSMFIFLPSVLLSGFLFPFRGMPDWAQVLGSCLPATYFMRIVRSIMLKGGDFFEIWSNIWPLLVIATVLATLAMKLYRRTLD